MLKQIEIEHNLYLLFIDYIFYCRDSSFMGYSKDKKI